MDKSAIKIMIVNDKLDLRAIIRDYLKDDGYTNLTLSENGLSAIRKAAADPPDLIIADYDLPGLTGLELLRQVRRDKTLERTPFIMVSHESERQFVAQAAEYNVDAYVVKPFSHQTLAEKVQAVLRRRFQPTESRLTYMQANKMVQEGHINDALEKYMEALEKTSQDMAAIHFKIGQVHENMNQVDEAHGDYLEAIALSPVHVESLDALGAIHLDRYQHEKALEYYQSGVEVSPLNARRQLAMGEAALQSSQYETAEKAFKKALYLDPNQTHAFNRLGIVFRKQGKIDEALTFFTKAIEAAPEDENLLFNLARAQLDKGEPEIALESLDRALELNPLFKEARELKAEARKAMNGRPAKDQEARKQSGKES